MTVPTSPQGVDSRTLLKRLRDVMADAGEGQARLDQITQLIAKSMQVDVCSIYLRRDATTLELCATEGLKKEAVHKTRMRIGQGLVGRVAESGNNINTDSAPDQPGFRYMPETGEEIYSSFLGVAIQRLGALLGVLVVQTKEARSFLDDQVHGLEITAMVLAEMTELGAFTSGDGAAMAPHKYPYFAQGVQGQEGMSEGHVFLHEPHVVVHRPVADDPEQELDRLNSAIEALDAEVERMFDDERLTSGSEHHDILETYRMFARSRGWRRRVEESIGAGLSAEAAVEREQSATRKKLQKIADPYLRSRQNDLDDLFNRMLRLLTGQGAEALSELPDDAVLIAREIGPGELLDYGNRLQGVVLEEGSVGSHAAVVARALAIPLVIQAKGITQEALNGDPILVDGDNGQVHLRPEEEIWLSFREKSDMRLHALENYEDIRDLPAETFDGTQIKLLMNAGLMADLPSLPSSGAEGVGLYRTELQFLIRSSVPRRDDLKALYARVLNAAGEKPVTFRTLDIGSDKVLPYLKPQDEPNPALGWRALRLGLDRPGVMRMQLQALIRAADGRPLSIMFPMVTQFEEFKTARDMVLVQIEREKNRGISVPEKLEVGAMLETPSLAFAPDAFFEMTDFISIGGNDLKQFFFAADRENERVRRRYDTLNVSYLTFLRQIVDRCNKHGVRVSFCGEDAGRPVDALCLAAIGLRVLSMRPVSVPQVKTLLRSVNLEDVRELLEDGFDSGAQSVRPAIEAWMEGQGLLFSPGGHH